MKSASCDKMHNAKLDESKRIILSCKQFNSFNFYNNECSKAILTRRALSTAQLPPTMVFRHLKTTRCCFDGRPISVCGIFPTQQISALQCIRYGRKQSGSGIRTMIQIRLKSWSVRPCPDTCRYAKCHRNTCTRFWVILLTDRQTNIAGNCIYRLRCRR